MTEYEKMHNGMIYDCLTEEIGNIQSCSHRLCEQYNKLGAGSVVTRDIPAGVLAAGNPCKVIREITEKDSMYLKVKK